MWVGRGIEAGIGATGKDAEGKFGRLWNDWCELCPGRLVAPWEL
jgi:hypothetical protein